MHTIFSYFLLLCLLLVKGPLAATEQAYDPLAVYLTWQRNPESTITIHWISDAHRPNDTVFYKKLHEEEWKTAYASHRPLPEGHIEYLIHTLELTDLEANTAYTFTTGHEGIPYKFHTMPAQLDTPIKFVVGGDIYHDSIEDVVAMNKIAAAQRVDFALLGGDIAYATDKYGLYPENIEKWLTFLEAWKKSMVTPEGFLIPMLPVISNEDTKKRYGQTPSQAPFFYALFATPGLPGYKVIDFGSYMCILLLDSGHTNYISGKQNLWISNALKQRASVPIKFALYHVPAYPSVRAFGKTHGTLIRNHWVPHFEKFHLTAAFENHDHAYKRTKLIKNNRVDNNGVLYIGDGGWGVLRARTPVNAEDRWYLAKTAAKQNIVIVTVLPNKNTVYQAIGRDGEIFDQFVK